MSSEWLEIGKTLRDTTFAMWFGWSIIIAIIIFPVTSTMFSCFHQGSIEDIELAKLEARHGDREANRIDTMKWMVTRGVHPLVARCAIFETPYNSCKTMIGALGDEDRSVIKELIANPAVSEVAVGIPAIAGLPAAPVRAEYYTKGLDFGIRSPTE